LRQHGHDLDQQGRPSLVSILKNFLRP